MNRVKKKGRTMVRCSICVKHKSSLLLHTKQKNHLPSICTELGTIPRNEILINHLDSVEHKECIKEENIKKSINYNKIMIEVLNDAIRGTLSAWSWPSSEVVQMKKSQFNLLEPHKKLILTKVIYNTSIQLHIMNYLTQ